MGVRYDKLLKKPVLHQHNTDDVTDSIHVLKAGDTMTGNLVLPTLQFTFTTLPTASSTYRGKIAFITGYDSVFWNTTAYDWNSTVINWNDITPHRDQLYLCRRSESGAYEWTAISDAGIWNAL